MRLPILGILSLYLAKSANISSRVSYTPILVASDYAFGVLSPESVVLERRSCRFRYNVNSGFTTSPCCLQAVLEGSDEDQIRMMEERVILTDYYDRVLGSASKKESEWLG